MTDKPEKLNIMDMPIYTYAPMQEDRPYIAQIAELPMIFRGETAVAANKSARKWREAKVQKEIDRKEKTAKRLEAARRAKKKEPVEE